MSRQDPDLAHRLLARAALIRVGGLALTVIVVSAVAYRMGWLDYRHSLQHIEHIRQSHSLIGFTVGLVIVFAIGTAAGLPAMPFTVAAGVMFGAQLGALLSWIASMLGAAIGYWVARTIGHDEVLKLSKRIDRIDRAVEQSRDFSGMLTLRLIPVLPIGTVNFIGGLARAPFATYMTATGIGIAPSLFIYAYFADRLIEGAGGDRRQALGSLLIASALLIVLALAPKLVNRPTS